jgi:hypothetical protein
MTDKVNETRRCYGIEMKVEKTKVMKISIKPSPVQFITNEKNRKICNISTVSVA